MEKINSMEQGGYCRFCGNYQPTPCFTETQQSRCSNGYKGVLENEPLVSIGNKKIPHRFLEQV